MDCVFVSRILVRLDNWEVGSQYPNGHFVRSLGVAGQLETEMAAILVEHGISTPPFSDAQVGGSTDQSAIARPSSRNVT